MNTESLKALVATYTDDDEYRALALQYGLKALACVLDGLDPEVVHTLSEFSPTNHFAHNLWRGHDRDDAL